mmetsp:Transcript_64274/g.207055  ORF Transcript_64274/g.207055 Transcript_64274/m.207055 type:complete len:217 (+) Transcript_64274:695-1345(+)
MSWCWSISSAAIWPSDSMLMPLAIKVSPTRPATLSLTACGLMNKKAECVLQARATSMSANLLSKGAWPNSVMPSGTFCGSEAMATMRCKQALASRSSRRSKRAMRWPSKMTSGLPSQYSTVARAMPAESSALPKGSSAMATPIQFVRSAMASKGLAEAWIPLSPVSGCLSKPRSCHFSWKTWRTEPCSAEVGSVAPRILLRKVCQGRRLGSHSTSM